MALDLGELSVRLSAEDQLSAALEGAQSAARRTDTVTAQAAAGVSRSTQQMAQGYQQLKRESETYATAARTAHSKAEVAIDAARLAQERLDAAQRDTTTSADQLERAQRAAADATDAAERATRNSEQANDRMVSSHRRAATAARNGGADAERAMRGVEDSMREAARTAATQGEEAGSGFSDRFSGGLEGLSGIAEGAGGSTGGSFIGGFAPRVAQLGAKAGPIGAALAGVAVLGIAAGALLADAIGDGMQQEVESDFIQAKLGINEETMAVIGKAAGDAYSNAWGESISANKTAAGDLIQAGVLNGEESSSEMQKMIEQATAVANLMGEDVPAVARAAGQSIKNGIAGDGTEAFDLLYQSQKNSLNISEDLLDSQVEYSTQLRALGLEGVEGWGLVSQGVQGGARDTDVVIDSLKELKLRATDGTAAAAEGFDKLNLNAESWTEAMNKGGTASRDALADALRGLDAITDPADKNAAALALFGTKFEDIQAAAFNLNLDTAAKEFGSLEGAVDGAMNTMGDNAATKMEMAKRSIEQGRAQLNSMMAEAFAPMLGDLADDVSSHKPEIIAFFTEVGGAALTLTSGMLSFGADFIRVMANIGDAAATAMGGVIGTMGDLVGVSAKVASAFGADGLSDTLQGLADGMTSWEDKTKAANGTLRTMADGMDAGASSLAGMRDGLVNTGAEMVAAENLARALGDEVEAIPNGKDIIVTSNSPEQQAQLEALGLKVEQLPDGTFRVTSNTDEGQRAIDAFLRANDGKNVSMFVDLEQRRVGYWTSKGVSAEDAPNIQGPVPVAGVGVGGGGGGGGNLGGGGGTFADGKLPEEAMIHQAGGKGLIQWAEDGAGPWEAFIPGAESKRARATNILADVADRFGYGLVQMADGGVVSGLTNIASDNFPALTMTSGYREGDPGFHGSGQAADFSNGSDNTPEQLAFANFMVDNYKPNLLELIYSAPGFDKNVKNGSIVDSGFYGASTMAGHRNHVHVAMSQPPGEPSSDPGSYDVGAQALTVTDYGQPSSGPDGVTSTTSSTSAGTLSTPSGPVDVRVINFADLQAGTDGGRTPKMVGNLKVFANGGIEDQNPQIATTGGPVRVWAEPQAGPWESYIPGDPAKRSRAIDIWRETGKRLNVTEFAEGGMAGFGGYQDPTPRDYMKPRNLYEAAALASGLGFTAASGLANYIGMAQSGKVDLSNLTPQFDTGSNSIPGLSEAFTQLVKPLEEILATLEKGGLVTADLNVDTSNGSVGLDLMKTGLA